MNSTLRALLEALADGAVHSGQTLGAELGISRAAVSKQLKQLGDYGIDVQSVPGLGYRLETALELLDLALIEHQLGDQARSALAEILIFDEIDSTNAELIRRSRSGLCGTIACLAEFQNSGRGRRGRHWQSPFASAVCLSVNWHFQRAMSALGGLGLALGVAAAETLQGLGVEGVGLKWPNDLTVDDRKLGGILIEVRGEAEGPCMVVAGIGLNFALHPAGQVLIDQPWTDLQTLCGSSRPERNQLTGQLLQHWARTLSDFANHGFKPYLQRWSRYDSLHSRKLQVEQSGQWISGTGAGVDQHGALLLETAQGLLSISGGEVSVRADIPERSANDPAH